jgi:hypothetical protein
MEDKFFIGILSHAKSEKRSSQKKIWDNLNSPNLIYYYFIGDPNIDSNYIIDEENKVVTLKVPDNYESLALKTKGIVEFYLENYSQTTKGMFKTDDDISVDPELIYGMLKENSEAPYFGLEVDIVNPYNSTWHWGKCESAYWNSKHVTVSQCKYCAGGGYYIKSDIAISMKDKIDLYNDFIFEDVATGNVLNSLGIYPTNIDVKNNGLNW